MKTLTRSMLPLCALGALALQSGQALAGCGSTDVVNPYRPMAYREGYGPFNTSRVTGLWKFTFTAEGNESSGAPPNALPLPDGTPVDAGYVTWHDDGTELMNSGHITPASGNFCMGVWKQVGPSTYRLNHWALSWIPDYQPGVTSSWSQMPGGTDEMFQAVGPANIEEKVKLRDDGNSYQGTFTLTQYLNDGTKAPITDTTGAPVAYVIVGTVSATRITAD